MTQLGVCPKCNFDKSLESNGVCWQCNDLTVRRRLYDRRIIREMVSKPTDCSKEEA